jgi:hypothetical protein
MDILIHGNGVDFFWLARIQLEAGVVSSSHHRSEECRLKFCNDAQDKVLVTSVDL